MAMLPHPRSVRWRRSRETVSQHYSTRDIQSYISKGIWRQGKGSFVRNSYVSTRCPVVICPYLCTSDLCYLGETVHFSVQHLWNRIWNLVDWRRGPLTFGKTRRKRKQHLALIYCVNMTCKFCSSNTFRRAVCYPYVDVLLRRSFGLGTRTRWCCEAILRLISLLSLSLLRLSESNFPGNSLWTW